MAISRPFFLPQIGPPLVTMFHQRKLFFKHDGLVEWLERTRLLSERELTQTLQLNILHCPCTQKYEPDCGVILVAHGLARTPLFTDFVGPGLVRARLLSVSRWTPIGPNPAIEWFSLQVDWPECRCWMILVQRAASAIRYIHSISNYEKNRNFIVERFSLNWPMKEWGKKIVERFFLNWLHYYRNATAPIGDNKKYHYPIGCFTQKNLIRKCGSS